MGQLHALDCAAPRARLVGVRAREDEDQQHDHNDRERDARPALEARVVAAAQHAAVLLPARPRDSSVHRSVADLNAVEGEPGDETADERTDPGEAAHKRQYADADHASRGEEVAARVPEPLGTRVVRTAVDEQVHEAAARDAEDRRGRRADDDGRGHVAREERPREAGHEVDRAEAHEPKLLLLPHSHHDDRDGAEQAVRDAGVQKHGGKNAPDLLVVRHEVAADGAHADERGGCRAAGGIFLVCGEHPAARAEGQDDARGVQRER